MDSFLRQKRKKNEILRSKELGLRRRLVKEWELLTDDEKVITRSLRSKKGIKCDKCGCVGYFIEICPNNCYEPPQKEQISHFGLERFGSDDEDAVTPVKGKGEGFFWSSADSNSEIEKPKRSYYSSKPDLTSLRHLTLKEKEKLRESDAKLKDYEFHKGAEEGYAQNFSELSLHQALRYFMRILEREIQENVRSLEAKDDLTLFHPPAEALSSHFYPKEVGKIKEYREYFHQQAMKKDRQIHSHQHHGALRPEEAMSVYYRAHGGGAGSSLAKSTGTLALYEPNPKAGQSIHGQIGWKSILSTNDDLAISDPKMAEKLTELSRLESHQSAWTAQQKRSFEHQNERFTHMWYLIKQEILQEHDREKRLLTVDAHANQKETEVTIWKERIDAADRLVETLRGYGYLRGTTEADYIVRGIDKWKAELARSRRAQQEQGIGGAGAKGDNNSSNRRRTKKGQIKGQGQRGKGRRERGSNLVMKSLVGIRSKTREEELQLQRDAGEESDSDPSDNDSAAVRKITSAVEASQLLASSSQSQGGYLGLGLLSTVGAAEVIGPRESSTGLSGQLLMNGAMGLVGSLGTPSPVTNSTSGSLKTKTKARVETGGTGAGGGTTIMARKKIQEKQLQLLASRYTDVGLQRNIRQGTSEDMSTCAPALIPFHEVLANRLPPEEIPKSHAGQQAIIEARRRDANPITGSLTPKYVPLYVRSTLFETNGTTPGGDQTYARMSHDRRYSHQLGRTMASLEPLPSVHEKVKEKEKRGVGKGKVVEGEGSAKKGGKLRLV